MVRTQIEKVETLYHHSILACDRLLPLAQQTVQACEIAGTDNRGILLEPITAQRTVRDTGSALQDHLTDYLSTLAELEMMVGAAFPGSDRSELKPQENL
jgi:hypothetical protein